MKTLFLAWQDPESRSWFPIGKLTYADAQYHFSYVQGALSARDQADFKPIWSFPDWHRHYTSIDLFPLFANRLLRRSLKLNGLTPHLLPYNFACSVT